MIRDKVKQILLDTFPNMQDHVEMLDAAGEKIYREVVEPEIKQGCMDALIIWLKRHNIEIKE